MTNLSSASGGWCSGVGIGSHLSSNADWARHDIMRPSHERDYTKHATKQHGQSEVNMLWLDTPRQSSELLALIERAKQEEDSQP